MRLFRLLALVLAGLCVGLGALPAEARAPLLIEGKKTLYQRVLARPGAEVVSDPMAALGKPVPPFTVFYVYGRQSVGGRDFVEVGTSTRGDVAGFIAADRVIDWKQSLTVAFANPAARERVLFLKDREALGRLMSSPARAAEAAAMRDAAIGDRLPPDSPVLAIEPPTFVDLARQFYLLPILNAEQALTDDGFPVRLLEVASVPANKPPVTVAAPPPPDPDEMLRRFKVGITVVIDNSVSMQPHIERTRDVVRRIHEQLKDTPFADNIRFGVVGFRDSTKVTPSLEYVAKVFSPLSPDRRPLETLAALDTMKATRVSSPNFYEDSFAGIKLALDEMDWGPFGGRYIILITDAGSRAANDPSSDTHLGPEQLSQLAQQKGIAVFALHLLTPAGVNDHARAEAQYRPLTRFPGAGSLYYPVPGGSPDAFGRMADQLVDTLVAQARATVAAATPAAPPPAPPAAGSMADQGAIVGYAMRMAYLGREQGTRAPDVFRAWTADRDTTKPTLPALDVRVLLTKNQLSDLAAALRLILDQGEKNRLSPQDFFAQLQSAAAATARDPSLVRQVGNLGDLLGEYLQDLPYRSQILGLDEREWLAMGPAAQREVLDTIEAKLRLYGEFDATSNLWIAFGEGQAAGETYFPVPLEALP
ncbi:vWA domain-containing protein [Zavarzinia compransoris]|nr:vWA domain-containing protein [Zavarzinia compransoris]TDP44992.1 von Willebrand factor type A domain-containing protein [Zavarzinia compransoris]